jgi:hypothetical protein
MQRYVNQFDGNTFVVIDVEEHREVCICENYEGCVDAKKRAEKIAALLNEKQMQT